MSNPAGSLVFEGDSITFLSSWPTIMLGNLGWTTGAGLTSTIAAVSGSTTSLVQTRADAADALLVTGPLKIFTLWAGSNDLGMNNNCAPIHTFERFVRICAGRRAKGAKVVAITTMPRNVVGDPTDFEANRQTLNALLRAWRTTYCDVLVDIGADSLLGAPGAYTNGTYFGGDQAHLATAGAQRAASLVAPAFTALAAA